MGSTPFVAPRIPRHGSNIVQFLPSLRYATLLLLPTHKHHYQLFDHDDDGAGLGQSTEPARSAFCAFWSVGREGHADGWGSESLGDGWCGNDRRREGCGCEGAGGAFDPICPHLAREETEG